MSIVPLKDSDKRFFDGRIHACPKRTHSTGFQLVDEFGDGWPYAGLTYEVTDYEDIVYTGKLDANGCGKVNNHYCGPVVLKLNQPYEGLDKTYVRLKQREHYPLPITELQVRAEKTRFFNPSGLRTETNSAQSGADTFYQVEVRELVEHVAHLPPLVDRHCPPNTFVFALFRRESPFRNAAPQRTGLPGAEPAFAPSARKPCGIALMPNRLTVLEVRPLRALRTQPVPTGTDVDPELQRLWSTTRLAPG